MKLNFLLVAVALVAVTGCNPAMPPGTYIPSSTPAVAPAVAPAVLVAPTPAPSAGNGSRVLAVEF